jgi:hypothetical protein
MKIILTFVAFIIAFLLHKYLLYPIENYIFSAEDEIVEHASLLYLPHAIRIIAYYVIGPIALLPIFLSQCFTNLLFNNAGLTETVNLSFLSTFAIFAGFYLYGLIKQGNLFNINATVDWKKIIIVGFLVSIFNSTLSSLYIHYFEHSAGKFHVYLNFKYLTGDMIGLVLGMFVFIMVLHIFKYWVRNVRN